MNTTKDCSDSQCSSSDDNSTDPSCGPTTRRNADHEELPLIRNKTTRLAKASLPGLGGTCVTPLEDVLASAVEIAEAEDQKGDQDTKIIDHPAVPGTLRYLHVDLNETCCRVRDIRYKKIYEMSMSLLFYSFAVRLISHATK